MGKDNKEYISMLRNEVKALKKDSFNESMSRMHVDRILGAISMALYLGIIGGEEYDKTTDRIINMGF